MGRVDLLFELEREPLPWAYDQDFSMKAGAPNGKAKRPEKKEGKKKEEKKKEDPILVKASTSGIRKEEIKKEEMEEEKKVYNRIRKEDEKKDEKKEEKVYSREEEKKEDRSRDDHVTEIYNDYDLYVAAKNGDLNDFNRVLDRVSAADQKSIDEILSRLSPVGNTYLHLAAKYGNKNVVNFIAEKKPSLILSKNFQGETALHLAVKAGDASMVEALLSEDEGDEDNNLLWAKNRRGNTGLHEALFNGQDSIAEYLIEKDPELSHCHNNDGESALYLAAEAGFAKCVSLILELSTDEERLNELFKNKSPIGAAIKKKHRDVLEAMFDKNHKMFDKNHNLIQLRDRQGRNPLHFAANLGYLEEVSYLLNKYPHNATQRDKKGFFPIHLASGEGHLDVLRLLLKDCLDLEEMLDWEGRNILHLAVMNGQAKIVDFILKNPDLESLINMKDVGGNTPLHWAAKSFQPKIASALTWDKRVDISLTNARGMTALDVARYYVSPSTQFTQILTWAALRAAGTPQQQSRKPGGRKTSSSNMGNYKDMVNTLLLVATLVVTVTFAAGFTVPGGYNSSESDPGMATLLRYKGFQVFIFCDTIAMYSSIVVAVALVWAQFSDITLVINAFTLAMPFLGIALSMMSVAFTAGVFVVVSKLKWLSTAVLVMGIAFLVILILLVLPLCTPLTSRNRILRYVSYYPLSLLIRACTKCLVV